MDLTALLGGGGVTRGGYSAYLSRPLLTAHVKMC